MANKVLITARPPELAPGLLLTCLLPAISVSGGMFGLAAVADEQRAKAVYCDLDCQTTCKGPIPLSVKAGAFLRMG